jgi:hypothetical protein
MYRLHKNLAFFQCLDYLQFKWTYLNNPAFLRCLDDLNFLCIFHKQTGSGSEIKVKVESGSEKKIIIISDLQHCVDHRPSVVDIVKEEFSHLKWFFLPSPHIQQGLRGLSLCLSRKRELAGYLYNNSWGIHEGAVTTLWVNLQRIAREGLRVHIVQRKVLLNRRGRREENIK